MAPDPSAERLALATTVAREAGEVLLSWRGRLESVDHKGAIDLVTAADRASEAHIVSRIRERFPDDAVLAEEGSGYPGTSGFEWVIDPLDGTTNFVHRHPFYMVSIGVRLAGERELGVCYAPEVDQLYSARRGHGAFRNGDRIRVSDTARLDASLLATGFPYDRREKMDALLTLVGRALHSAHGIRRGGSACYDLCLLAVGSQDGFFEQGLHAWDLCAGTLIVEEAGGRLSDYDGGAFDLFGDTVVATNGHIHDEVLSRVLAGR